MTRILGDVRPHRWQFGDLITVNIFHRGGLFELPRQPAGFNLRAAAGLEQVVESFLRPASWRSRSAICFSELATFFRSRSFSLRRRSFSRRSSSCVKECRSTAGAGCFNRCPGPFGFAFDALIHFDGILLAAKSPVFSTRGGERLLFFVFRLTVVAGAAVPDLGSAVK